MELKKSPKADLQKRKGMFLEIGLAVSLALMIAMFGISQSEKTVEIPDMDLGVIEEEIIDVTVQDETPPPPEPTQRNIQVVSDIINVVKDDTKIDVDLTFDEFDDDFVIPPPPPPAAEESTDVDEPFLKVETMPKFQGGNELDFRNWVQGNVRYPAIAAENGIQGRVIVQFVVERDGSVGDIQVLSSPDRSLSDAAISTIHRAPKWEPGRQRTQTVRVKFIIPIEFILQ